MPANSLGQERNLNPQGMWVKIPILTRAATPLEQANVEFENARSVKCREPHRPRPRSRQNWNFNPREKAARVKIGILTHGKQPLASRSES